MKKLDKSVRVKAKASKVQLKVKSSPAAGRVSKKPDIYSFCDDYAKAGVMSVLISSPNGYPVFRTGARARACRKIKHSLFVVCGKDSGNLSEVVLRLNDNEAGAEAIWSIFWKGISPHVREGLVVERNEHTIRIFYRSAVSRDTETLAVHDQCTLILFFGGSTFTTCYPGEGHKQIQGSLTSLANLSVAEEKEVMAALQEAVSKTSGCKWVAKSFSSPVVKRKAYPQ